MLRTTRLKAAFLKDYLVTGSQRLSARRIGVCVKRVWEWQEADPDFKVAMHEAPDLFREAFRSRIIQRGAKKSDVVALRLLANWFPEDFGVNRPAAVAFLTQPGSQTTVTQTTSIQVKNYTDEELRMLRQLMEKGGVHLPPAPEVIDVAVEPEKVPE